MRKIIQNKKLIYSLVFAAFISIISLLLNKGWFFYNDISKEHKHIQERFLEREKLINSIFLEFDSTYKNTDSSLHKYLNYKNSHLVANDMSFFVYDQQNLLYWSDDKTPIQNLYYPEKDSSGLLQLKNGLYYFKINKKENLFKIGLILLQTDFRYENNYLENKISKYLTSDNKLNITKSISDNKISNADGKYIFSLTKKTIPKDQHTELLMLFIYILIVSSILFFVDNLINILKSKSIIILIVILLRFISFYFKYPHFVYELSYFSPKYFAISYFIPSIGDLIFNLIFLLYIIQVTARILLRKVLLKPNKKLIFSIVTLFITFIIFILNIELINNIITNSKLNFDLLNYSNEIDNSAFIISIVIILITAIIYYCTRLSIFLFKDISTKIFIITLLALNIVSVIIFYNKNITEQIIPILIYSIVIYIFRLFSISNYKGFFLKHIIFIAAVSIIFSYIINFNNNIKELNYRKTIALKLADEHDPLAEFFFIDLRTKILDDEIICNYINNTDKIQQIIRKRLQQKYVNGYFSRYDFQITICNQNDRLFIKHLNQQKNCIQFFKNIVKDFGIKTICPDFYFLDYGTGRKSYLAILEYPHVNSTSFLFIEFDSKVIAKDPGYPDLLMNLELYKEFSGISKYSYAKYKNNDLVHRYGSYFYDISLKKDTANSEEILFLNKNNYSHLIYKLDDVNTIVVSIKNKDIIEYINPFTFIFILLLFVLFVYYFANNMKMILTKRMSLKDKIRMYMIFLVICSFLLMMFVTITFINRTFEIQNNKELKTKSQSILSELEKTFFQQSDLSVNDYDLFSEHILQLANLFATDINMYDSNGKLLISSRPQIFEEGFAGMMINPNVYRDFIYNNKTFIILDENIGKLKYNSSYMPIRNYQNKTIAYLNIPYFAKETDMKKELYSFVITTINIYTLLIMLAISIAVFISTRITKPLSIIKEKLRNIKIGIKNEKIEWNKQDEIGQLINEYNRLVDELIISASKLAKSERESAWREMARQIAHEIKNPLTPMKLNLQYLQKIIIDKNENWESKFNKSANSIIEQIDSIASIANAFSEFAKFHAKTEKEKILLKEFIYQHFDLYLPNEKIKFTIFNVNISDFDYIFYDKTQLISVLNNLVKNSANALENIEEPLIKIILLKKENLFEINIEDNGPGVPLEMKEKIFNPYFTTKTTGTGLGLAIVKTIVENHNGKIEYFSEPFIKTVFTFTIPIINSNP
ncbi:MAG: hypothetical protein A2X02_04820 [Bacteroidetes bacterium GWF2_29_10]|nr:MAG: hypothetical protein A2X02_04820 [Bacteroidetes bacterium GWF2_29_10]